MRPGAMESDELWEAALEKRAPSHNSWKTPLKLAFSTLPTTLLL
jgi:hypothetical protein